MAPDIMSERASFEATHHELETQGCYASYVQKIQAKAPCVMGLWRSIIAAVAALFNAQLVVSKD